MIPIRALQHYFYCPHRWGMLYLDDRWEDNAFTVLAEQVHGRVHSEKILRQTSKIISFGDVTVYSEKLGIYGKTDSVELIRDPRGVCVQGLEGTYSVNLVEYKPTQPKTPSVADRIQLYAQYRCLSEIFRCEANAFIYYADVRRRIPLNFNDEDERLLLRLVSEINDLTEKQIVPPPEYGKKCNCCSLAEKCLPKVKDCNVRTLILGENI